MYDYIAKVTNPRRINYGAVIPVRFVDLFLYADEAGVYYFDTELIIGRA